MGNLLFGARKRSSGDSSRVARRGLSSTITSRQRPFSSPFIPQLFDPLSQSNQNHSSSSSSSAVASESNNSTRGAVGVAPSRGLDKKKKYAYIPDNYTTIDQSINLHDRVLMESIL